MRKQRTHYYGGRFTIGLCLFMAFFFVYALINPAYAKTTEGKDLLQFTSGNHILAFSTGSVRLASGTHMLKVDFIGGNKVVPVSKEGASSEGKAQPLTRVTYPNAWDGIDIAYEKGKTSIVKSTYTVSSGKKPSSIRLGYNRPLSVDKNGNLVITYDTGRMTESKPLAWQIIEGQKKPVMVAYNLYTDHELGFTVGDYDKSLPLVIDPDLVWNAFLGSSVLDIGFGIAVDSNGDIYVAGQSNATWGSPILPFGGGTNDAFVAKLTSDGTVLWNTFLGGTGKDYGQGIALDGSGNVYVTGYSTASWGSPLLPYGGGTGDAFAAKLTSDGALVWNTFLGGTGVDIGYGIAVDGSANIYVTGQSGATWGSPKSAYGGGTCDAFAAKLTSDGALVWNTFLGGTAADYGYGIAVDGTGNAYVTGYSLATWGSPKLPYTAADAFVAKLAAADGALLWNTFLGESGGDDRGRSIASDAAGNTYVAGQSTATWGSPQRPFTEANNHLNAFAAKLDTDGALLWNTFLGGEVGFPHAMDHYGYGVAQDSLGYAYVAGYSTQEWGSPTDPFTGRPDIWAAKLSSDGALVRLAFLGGTDSTGNKSIPAIALDSGRFVYLTGRSTSFGTPVLPFQGGTDAFVAKVSTGNYDLSVSKTGDGTGTVTSSPSGINCGSTCSALYVEGTVVTLTAAAGTHSTFGGWGGACSGTGTCVVTMSADVSVTATFNVATIYAVNASVSGGHGTVDPTSQQVYDGDSATITITPDDRYRIATITDNGQPVTLTGTVNASSGAKQKPASSAKKAAKSRAKSTASAKSASAKPSAAASKTYVINNVTTDHTVVVAYEPDTYNLAALMAGPGKGTLSAEGLLCSSSRCTGTYANGTPVTITATPDTDYTFTGFTGCVSTSGNTCTVHMTSNLTVTATFGNPCTYTISSAEKDFAYKGGSVNITVKATGAGECANPHVSANDTWIGAALTSFKKNSGTVKVTVTPNTTVAQRPGSVTIEGNNFAVKQAGAPCTLTISSSNDTQTAAAGTDSFTLTATTGCAWSAGVDAGSSSWLSTTSTGIGSGPVSYAVLKNATAKARSGKITVSFNDAPKVKKVFTVKQTVCTLAISATHDSLTGLGGTKSFGVTTPAMCPWTAQADSKATWLSTTSTGTGGSGLVWYEAQPNGDKKQRTGKITVHLDDIPTVKKVFTVTESK